jgi:hypothetical protein
MIVFADQASSSAPRDGSVYRGFFERSTPRGAMFKAVSWRQDRGWVDLQGVAIDETWRLSAWSPD